MRFLVTGAAGSGTSSLAAALAQHWAARTVEADAFYWLPTDPPYTSRREPHEREAMFRRELLSHERLVIAGSVVGWGVDTQRRGTIACSVKVTGAVVCRSRQTLGLANTLAEHPSIII